jgi:L-arabinose isomerase
MRRPRAGLLPLYVPFYEPIVPLRAEKEAFASGIAAQLAASMDIVNPGLVDTMEGARAAGQRFREACVDLVIVVPTVAVFGALGWAALEELDAPVCVWAVQPAQGIPDGYNIQELIRNSGGLGVQALANTIARAGRCYTTVFGTHGKLDVFARVAAVAADLRSATFGRIGSIFPQMTDVLMDAGEWTRKTGSKVVDVDAVALTKHYEAVEGERRAERLRELGNHRLRHITSDELERSAQLSIALDDIVEEHQLDGGAFNCHGTNCLRNPAIGITACYGVSRQTSHGKPFSCTGDLPTAIALFLMTRLAGAAIYGELDLVDPAANVVLLANGGEGDFRAAAGSVEITGNENFAGLHGRGASPVFQIARGPATILSFTPIDHPPGYRLILAAGEIVEREAGGLGVFHACFRFAGLSAPKAFEGWCDSGAVHHLALGPGDWRKELHLIARMLRFDCMEVGGGNAAQG